MTAMTSRDAVELAAQPTPAERAAAAPTCPCGKNHRAGSGIAKQHAAMFTPALALAPLPPVTAEDLRGVLTVWRGAAYVRGAQILVIGQVSRDQRLVKDDPFLTQEDVIGLLVESGTVVRRLRRGADFVTPSEWEAAADLLAKQLDAEASAMALAA